MKQEEDCSDEDSELNMELKSGTEPGEAIPQDYVTAAGKKEKYSV